MKRPHFAIPEIYGDSLSYYEVLRELIEAMNVVIENYDTIPEQIADAVKNLDAAQLFSAVLDQLINTIATDNTKSANAVKVYKKHDLLYAIFNETVNLYEALIDFTPGTETELIPDTNIRVVNISELFIELRKLIDDEVQARNIGDTTLQRAINTEKSAREQADTNLQNAINTEKSAREQADTNLQNAINTEKSAREHGENKNNAEIAKIHSNITSIENKNTEQDDELGTLRTMISSPYNFKGDVASISALPESGNVNDTYYVQDVKYKVTWTGSAWVQSSLNEADYQTELSELKGDLDNISGQPNYYDVKWTVGGYIDKTNGNLITYDGWHYTDYIELENNDNLYVSTSKSTDNEYNAFYDSNKAFIRNLYINGNSDHSRIQDVPQNAKYVRLSCESQYSINLYHITTVADLEKRVTKLETEKSQQLPSYYEDYMVEKNSLVNTKMDLINNCLAFVFFTDPHIGTNKLRSPKMIDSILKNTSVKDVICGGDVISAYGNEASMVIDCETYMDYWGSLKPYFTRGNHDIYAKEIENINVGYIEPNSMVINRFIRPFHDDMVIPQGKTYYYVDRPNNKIRYIFIDTNENIVGNVVDNLWNPIFSVTQTQIDWFIDLLKDTPNGYKIVLFNHIPITAQLEWGIAYAYIFGDIVEAFNNKTTVDSTNSDGVTAKADFSNSSGKIILSIGGHGHTDDVYTSPSGCVYYEVNCDTLLNNGGSPYERVEGTVSEQSFDVVIINADNGDIHTVRYGAGIDRTLISH